MQITIQIAQALTRIKSQEHRVFVDDYLEGLLREAQDKLAKSDDSVAMRRAQGKVQLLQQILKEIEDSTSVLGKLQQNQPRRPQ